MIKQRLSLTDPRVSLDFNALLSVDRAGLEPAPTVNNDLYSVGVGSKPILALRFIPIFKNRHHY